MMEVETDQELLDALAKLVARYLKHTWVWTVPDKRASLQELVKKYQGRQCVEITDPKHRSPNTYCFDVTLEQAQSIVSTALQQVHF